MLPLREVPLAEVEQKIAEENVRSRLIHLSSLPNLLALLLDQS